MRKFCNLFSLLSIANNASICRNAFCLTSCRRSNDTTVPSVGKLICYGLCHKDCIADGALATFGESGRFASGGNSGNGHRRMRRFCNGLRLCRATARAGIGHNTFCLAGCRGCYDAVVPIVGKFCRFGLLHKDRTASEAHPTYEEIKAYIQKEYGVKVSSLYISQVKRRLGLEVGDSFNKPKRETAKQPQCPLDKEKLITKALRYFKMID